MLSKCRDKEEEEKQMDWEKGSDGPSLMYSETQTVILMVGKTLEYEGAGGVPTRGEQYRLCSRVEDPSRRGTPALPGRSLMPLGAPILSPS